MIQGFPLLVISCVLLAGAALFSGCLSPVFGEPPHYTTQEPVLPSPEIPVTRVPLAEMALVGEDLPAGYAIKDRSVIAYDETSQLTRDLGWIQGYRVIHSRVNHAHNDITAIRQVIGIYATERINQVYTIEKETLLEQANGTKRYEIAFPKIGDKSVAVRITETDSPQNNVILGLTRLKQRDRERMQ